MAVSAHERDQLESWARGRNSTSRLAIRSAIVLEVAKGRSVAQVARSLRVHPATVERWCTRFLVNRLDGIRRQAPRSRARAEVPWRTVERILELSRQAPPADSGRWTTRSMARAVSVSHMFVHRVWERHRIRPTDPPTAQLVRLPPPPARTFVDIVGVFDGNGGRLAAFELTSAPTLISGFLANPIDVGSTGVSGGISLDQRESFSRYLVPLLGALGDEDPSTAPAPTPSPDLLIFLRSLDYQVPATSNLWLVSKGIRWDRASGLAAWLRQHPRFQLHEGSGPTRWEAELRRWAATRLPGRIHPASFPNVSSCHASIARRLSEGRDRILPFAWTPTFDSLRGWGPVHPDGGTPPSAEVVLRSPSDFPELSFSSKTRVTGGV
ncbi:MAG TPA: helix-turn-helix domain-containing protein [Thermoplasmata archaeon]|nr:helix-turn-helix domain-containing protein [Thermoplasmata archaeon]